jgi:hypothetical protein
VRPESRDVLIRTNPDTGLSDYLEMRLIASDSDRVSPTLPTQTPVAALFPDHRVS